ncbi:MAG: sulfatase-like hydrolase/transferase, partial [Thaumarchaeota archaeon]|nr:sulfatase-like hydrolase/transferase [Nitrososphaerota archaeon]
KSEDNLYNGLGERILKKLDSLTSPWFYYIHLEDLHTPCVVPEELGHLKLTERYDRNIFEIDSLIGKILKKINQDETLIVITSDHGEYISPIQGPLKESASTKVAIKNLIKKLLPRTILIKLHIKKRMLLGKIQASKTDIPHEKRIFENIRKLPNKALYDDIVRVPLLFTGFGINSIPSISQQICNIDIFPTILELIGIPITIQNLYGRSLVPLLKGKELDSIPIYMTSSAIIKELHLNIKIDYSSSPLVGIRTQNFKYFRNVQDPKKDVHLYDLQNDPLEDNNIANERSDIVKEMELNIEKIKKDALPLSNEEELSEEEIKRAKESLKRLGYI